MTTTKDLRPVGLLDARGRVIPGSFEDTAFQGDYAGTTLIYAGFARPGTATTATCWKIKKLNYDGSGNLTSITWPQDTSGAASNDYIFQWSARAGYTYS